ncbi:MAG: 50S ribosomal protein L35 [Candidatus Kuenenbacteria bacterium]
MPKQKTVKSFSKRFKITKTGKVKKVKKSQNHFNAKETGKKKRNKRLDSILSPSHARAIKKIINST